MIAVVNLAPGAAHVSQRLQLIANFLRDANIAWLREQLAMGYRPPARASLAMPPWSAGGSVVYVPFHGDTPHAELRHYFDGPSMFARRKGTCIDIGAYDAAAATVLERTPTDVVVLPLEQRPKFHVWLSTPGQGLVDATRDFRKVG